MASVAEMAFRCAMVSICLSCIVTMTLAEQNDIEGSDALDTLEQGKFLRYICPFVLYLMFIL